MLNPLFAVGWFQTLAGFLMFFGSLFLIMLVLVQRGRGGGLSGAFGGMGGQSAFGAKAGDTFTRITVVTATLWIVLCMAAVRFTGNSDGQGNAALQDDDIAGSADLDPSQVGGDPVDSGSDPNSLLDEAAADALGGAAGDTDAAAETGAAETGTTGEASISAEPAADTDAVKEAAEAVKAEISSEVEAAVETATEGTP